MGKMPALQFYPRDWKSDLELQSCSLEARGLWIELMCVMHESDPYGYLLVNGVVPSESVVSRLVGIHPGKYRRLLGELLAAGVAATNEDGAVFSRRMVKDEHLRQARREAGQQGGNPLLLKQKDNLIGYPPVPPPSSSSSSSSSSSKKKSIKVNLVTEFDCDFEEWYSQYPRKKGKSKAQEYFFARRKAGMTNDKLLMARDELVTEIKEEGTETRFIPYASTFLGPSGKVEDYYQQALARQAEERRKTEEYDRRMRAFEKEDKEAILAATPVDPERQKKMAAELREIARGLAEKKEVKCDNT